MLFPIITPNSSWHPASKEDFVSFWKVFYIYPDKEYFSNIGKELTENRVFVLFEWKNGGKISERKIASIRENYLDAQLQLPSDPTQRVELEEYWGRFSSTIWPIFWLHVNSPTAFPIFDQHVFRSMRYIQKQEICEPPYSSKKYSQIYIDEYVPFVKSFGDISRKDIDMALMAFGQFLKKKHAVEGVM